MTKDSVHCRLCGGSRTRNQGRIPDCGEFAGRPVAPPLPGGYLIHCLECSSSFRSPVLSDARYAALYQNSPDMLWERHQEKRNDLKMVRKLLTGMDGGTILDVGCYSGLFLRSLPAGFDKFGVEPSDAASRVAQLHGIDILGKSLSQVHPDRRFDILLAIDVVEHLIDVNEFIEGALGHLKENGTLMISTGNPDSIFFKKIFRARFWYPSLAEHLTFPSMDYFAGWCKKAGLARPSRHCFSYLERPPGLKFLLGLAQLMFFASPAAFRSLERILRKTTGMAKRLHPEFGLSAGGAFTDHQLIVMKNTKEKNGSMA